MSIQAGTIIKSTEALKDTYFESTKILITNNDHTGATGFVINRPFPRKLNELREFKSVPAFPLYEGGPVDTEHLYFIHRRPDLISGGVKISTETYFAGDFNQVVTLIKNNSLTTADIKIFVGYCGWDSEELEDEIREGSWAMCEGDFNENLWD